MTVQFEDFNLRPELVQAITELGYTQPTPIQTGIIPLMQGGHDVTGQAQTGTGKTAAFALPILNRIDPNQRLPQALVVAPTRELALQVTEMIQSLGQFMDVRVLTVYGGTSYTTQLNQLRRGVHVVVGTPGRILDLVKRGRLELAEVRTVVLDEADEMLSMGFIEDMEAILAATPEERQTTLFSATLPPRIRELARKYLRNPKTISIQPEQVTVAATEQRVYYVNEFDKLAVLTRLFEMEEITSALIFTRTRIRTGELVTELNQRGYPSEALSGDLSQDAREHTMARFRSGQIKVLVATDVAARGLDVEGITHVFNYDLPEEPETFVHRIGRTGRAGRTGIAISLARPSERRQVQQIEKFTHQEMQEAVIPTVEEIQGKRVDSLLEKVETWLKRGRAKEERALVETLLAMGYDPLDIAAAALKVARAEEKQRPIPQISPLPEKAVRPERRPRTERTERSERAGRDRTKGRERRESAGPGRARASIRGKQSDEEGMIRLELGLGKVDGLRPSDVVASIASIAGIPGSALGRIYIQNHRTTVDVSEQYLDQVISANNKYKVRNQTFTLTKG
ncbi:MAG: DEAD/DEAH box helicase [Anaerolineaceae bacterium]|jgi:ATP-dependent RNA helicase DeaD|nr:DEAD/DEAH box helicase [Anaerolineaceae bacterium]MDD4578147.1 DEAD/DEAH box helicase [Anaerolineaceae bacterium]